MTTMIREWFKKFIKKSPQIKKEVGGFEILDGVVIGPMHFSKDGKQSSALICPPIWAFNYGITNALNRLNHPATEREEFQSEFNSLLDDLISEILIYFENRLKIIVVSDKLKYKINSIPEAIKAYKKLAEIEISNIGDADFLKTLDRKRGERHHTHRRHDDNYFIGSDDFNTIEKLRELCRKVRIEIQNIDQNLSQTHRDYEIKVARLPSAINVEWKSIKHAFDMKQGGRIVPQQATTRLDPRQIKWFSVQLNYKK